MQNVELNSVVYIPQQIFSKSVNSSYSFVDKGGGELDLILYTICDALYSAKCNSSYSDRFDDVLWITEFEREKAKDKSLQFYCELIGVNFSKIRDILIDILCDSSLFNSNSRVRVTYRCEL